MPLRLVSAVLNREPLYCNLIMAKLLKVECIISCDVAIYTTFFAFYMMKLVHITYSSYRDCSKMANRTYYDSGRFIGFDCVQDSTIDNVTWCAPPATAAGLQIIEWCQLSENSIHFTFIHAGVLYGTYSLEDCMRRLWQHLARRVHI